MLHQRYCFVYRIKLCHLGATLQLDEMNYSGWSAESGCPSFLCSDESGNVLSKSCLTGIFCLIVSCSDKTFDHHSRQKLIWQKIMIIKEIILLMANQPDYQKWSILQPEISERILFAKPACTNSEKSVFSATLHQRQYFTIDNNLSHQPDQQSSWRLNPTLMPVSE